jgi:perosamine synthetase
MQNKKELALFKGKKTINYRFIKLNTIGREEILIVKKVLKSGKLSSFLAGNLEGGYYVKKFEKFLCKFYKVKYAITVNSWTSGLICAVGSLDINPGDEIITSPWSMCASSTAILHWNAIPVFADIDQKNFCIDPEDIKKKITKRTKAIIAIDIFGQSSDINKIKQIIKGTKIKLISDSAQCPFSYYKGKITGTISNIGGYSLNFHKHINVGEGGIIVTNNSRFARRMKLIRNHAEAYKFFNKKKELNNMLGYNFRMGEIEAAIGIEQYKKLKKILVKREKLINFLTKNLQNLNGLIIPTIQKNFGHNYYIYPLVLNFKKINYSRKFIVRCLKSEGVQGLYEGYVNIHRLPMYQNKIAYGSKGFPWSIYNNKINYKKGICPISEHLNDKSFFSIHLCLFDLSKNDMILISKSFQKVWKILKI